MPKFNKEKTDHRDQLVCEFLVQSDDEKRPSLADINDMLKAQTGARMNSTRLSKLRERIYADLNEK